MIDYPEAFCRLDSTGKKWLNNCCPNKWEQDDVQMLPAPVVERMIAEAEQQGYQRALDELAIQEIESGIEPGKGGE